MVRFGSRSAISPPHAPKINTGSAWSAVTRPSAVPEPVSSSTRIPCATDCIHVPDMDMACPTKNRRKLRMASDAKVRWRKEPVDSIAVLCLVREGMDRWR